MKKTFIGATMLSLIFLGISSTVIATESDYTVIDPYKDIPVIDDKTSVGVQVTDTDPASISFEVPLFITAAIMDGQASLLVPDNYAIKNTTTNYSSQGGEIAVTQVQISRIDGSSDWTLVTDTPTQDGQMQVTIGGITMREPTQDLTYLDLTDSIFYDKNAQQFAKIQYNQVVDIPIVANVLPKIRLRALSAVAQFRIHYTISLLDLNGDPIGVGVFYEGDTPWD